MSTSGGSDQPQEDKALHHVPIQEIIDHSHRTVLPCDYGFEKQPTCSLFHQISVHLISIFKTSWMPIKIKEKNVFNGNMLISQFKMIIIKPTGNGIDVTCVGGKVHFVSPRKKHTSCEEKKHKNSPFGVHKR